jgi:hypothetical protein
MDKSYEALIQPQLWDGMPSGEGNAEAKLLCAYNQTKGCVLGAEVASGDFSFASLAHRMPQLTPESGTGLWIVPFKGIPTTNVRVPLDLIYLDARHQVIETVELFPTYRVSPSSPAATSVLALPTQSIFNSHTQAGDQVAFCLAGETELEMSRLFGSSSTFPSAQEEPATRETPNRGVAAASQPAEEDSAKNAATAPPAEEAVEARPWMKQANKPRNWLLRWLFPDPPDPRKAPRAALPGLSAYFWTGGSPQPHDIRNISDTGLYVVTDERWYPDTLVQMTLRKTGRNGAKAESSISLLARANRWGNDGVGLSFVVRDPRKPRDEKASQSDGIDREELDRFLALIKSEKS